VRKRKKKGKSYFLYALEGSAGNGREKRMGNIPEVPSGTRSEVFPSGEEGGKKRGSKSILLFHLKKESCQLQRLCVRYFPNNKKEGSPLDYFFMMGEIREKRGKKTRTGAAKYGSSSRVPFREERKRKGEKCDI